ncbi:MAG: L,D-transpeptidase family protein [Nitrospirae bacterium]|nr:L,D-transpeptidase family protein [Nitrospirota bacterium]
MFISLIKQIKLFLKAAIIFSVFNISIPVYAEVPVSSGIHADYILVEKSLKHMTLYYDDKPIKTYNVALGRNPKGPKLMEGDLRTPEGRYVIDSRNSDSKYHLSLHISYPNEVDLQITGIAGVSPGGDVMIHGTGEEYAWMGAFHDVVDWTDGCIAVTDEEIEEIWKLVPDGTRIEILP